MGDVLKRLRVGLSWTFPRVKGSRFELFQGALFLCLSVSQTDITPLGRKNIYKSVHMAEPHQEKRNSSFQDKPIGEKIDFTFDPGTKRQAKVFDSDKLDMDFNLNGDMSDLDSSNLSRKGCKVDPAEGFSTLDDESKIVVNISASKLPPGTLIGTTVIGVVSEEVILIASEGRLISIKEDTRGEIITGAYEKIIDINDYILASFSGNVKECEHLILKVREAFILTDRNEVTMTAIERKCKEYMSHWKHQKRLRKEDDIFPGEVLFYGYEDGKACIYSAAEEKNEQSDIGTIFGSGSGFDSASEYLREQLKNQATRGKPTVSEYSKLLAVSVGVATLNDPNSGGYVFAGAVWRNKKAVLGHRRKHVLEVLKDNYEIVQSCFSKILFLTSHGARYQISTERHLKEKVFEEESQEIKSVHVLGVGKYGENNDDYMITRVIVYKDADHQLRSTIHPGSEIKNFFSGKKIELYVSEATEHMIEKCCRHLKVPLYSL